MRLRLRLIMPVPRSIRVLRTRCSSSQPWPVVRLRHWQGQVEVVRVQATHTNTTTVKVIQAVTAGSGRSDVGVQHFAEGGLVTSPTLAMIGEGKSREAAIPLDDPEAMDTIGKAITSAGGGGSNHFRFHAPVIGASDVAELCGQISKRVARGQAHLNSSSTFKVTKRGG